MVEVAAAPVEPVDAILVEPRLQVHPTRPVVTPLKPSRWSSSFGLAYARAPPERARLLELALATRHRFPVLNPDQA